MGNDNLFSPSWLQPAYVTYQSVSIPDTYTLVNYAYEEQWRRIQSQLAQYSTLQNNWDGLGSLAAPANVFATAARVLQNARDRLSAAPSVATLSPNGAVQIEWWSGPNVIQAEIGDPTKIEWVEFGPNRATKYWSEEVKLDRSARGQNWPVTSAVEGRVAVSASET